jgi:hypothetical protein
LSNSDLGIEIALHLLVVSLQPIDRKLCFIDFGV